VKKEHLLWKCHLPNLFAEILNNEGTQILKTPLRLTFGLLQDVARRANEINDPELNHLMAALTLYTVADPEHKDYDKDIVEQLEKEYRRIKK